jgi:hypothetical protein
MIESQAKRIARLGNEDRIWYGQSEFYRVIRFPCYEHVTLTAGCARARRCQGCREPMKAGLAEDSRNYGVEAVIRHHSAGLCSVWHRQCTTEPLAWAHEQQHERPKAPADGETTMQPRLFAEGW